MTTPAPTPEQTLVAPTNQKGSGRKEPDNDHYRMRLSPGLPTNCVCRYRNRRLWRAAVGTLSGSARVLSRARDPGKEGACRDGSQWTRALVRATAGRTENRPVDGGCRGDPSQARAQAEDGS